MSIVLAICRAGQGCIATDSQETNLNTGNTTYDAVKSCCITDGLIVGFAGHSKPCQRVLERAILIHQKVRSNDNMVTKFAVSLNDAAQFIQLEYGLEYFKQHKASFLIIGPYTTNLPLIIRCGTDTRFQPVPVAQDNTAFYSTLLNPEDISYEQCITISNRLQQEYGEKLALPELASLIIRTISQQSKYCGGEPQILPI